MAPTSLLWSTAALGAVLLTAPNAACATAVAFLNGTIVTRIPAKELPALQAAIGNVLNTGADHATSQWSSTPRSPGHPPVQVEFTPLQSVQTQTANTCRLLDARVSQRKRSEQWQFWFCKQEDGSWKASGSHAPR